MEFLDLGISKKIVDILNDFGFKKPTEVQQKTIPCVLKKQDVIVRSETGSGKTFAFILPILQNIDIKNNSIQSLIICPTRELAMQVADESKKIAEKLGVKICAVFGGSNLDRQVKALKKNPQIVVGTTGRILDLMRKNALKIQNVNFVVLDEADEMLDMGFLPDIEKILKNTKREKQTLLFSATMPSNVVELAKKYQKDTCVLEIGVQNQALSSIEQYYIFTDKKFKKQALLELFFCDIFEKTIIFTNTKTFAEDLENFFNKNKLPAKALHSDIRQNERKRVLQAFRDGKISILIATDVASRGLDIKEVKYVVNFDIPHQLEYYVHRIGRTARAGESGYVVNFVTTLEQLSHLKDIERETKANILQYQTNSVNLSQYFVDTKKLAKKTNNFANTPKDNLKFNNKKQKKFFEDDFNQKQNKFKRFSTFDYFEDFYEEEKKSKSKKTFKKQDKNNKNFIKSKKSKSLSKTKNKSNFNKSRTKNNNKSNKNYRVKYEKK